MGKCKNQVLLLGLCAQAAAGQIPIQPVSSPPFTESRSSVVKTSGGEMLGLVGGGLDVVADGRMLAVSGLLPSDRTVCVAIRHVGGSYSASFTVPLKAAGPTLRFRLPANEIHSLQATRGELAILVRSSAEPICDRSSPILPASWGDTPPSGTGTALINDHQALRTQVVGRGRPPVRCSRLATPVLTAYQVTCPVDLSGACGAGVLAVQFIDGTSQDTLRVPMRHTC